MTFTKHPISAVLQGQRMRLSAARAKWSGKQFSINQADEFMRLQASVCVCSANLSLNGSTKNPSSRTQPAMQFDITFSKCTVYVVCKSELAERR